MPRRSHLYQSQPRVLRVRVRKRIQLRNPTRRASQDPRRPEPADAASRLRQSKAARSPRHPRISPSLAAFLDEGLDRRSTGLWAGGLLGEQRAGWRGAGRPHNAVADQPRHPTVGVAVWPARHRFEACDRAPAIDDQNRRTALQTRDQRAQPVFSFGYTGLLHLAIIAFSIRTFKARDGLPNIAPGKMDR